MSGCAWDFIAVAQQALPTFQLFDPVQATAMALVGAVEAAIHALLL